MAKALVGHIGGPDPRMAAEMRRMQERIQDLEAEIVRLQAENDTLHAATRSQSEPRGETAHEPALT